MAMYRLSASVLSRSQGRSSVAAAAYRAGEKLQNVRDGMEHDYSKRVGVVSAEVMLPAGAPAYLADREVLWNTVEAAEKRRDAQVAREVQLALPHELSAGQRETLVRGFVQAQFVGRGMVADVAIHAPGVKGDTRNHHAHVLLTTRAVSPDGFEGKNRDWNAKELLTSWREEWADEVNAALERYDIAERVDHRSLEDQRADHLERSQDALEAGEVERASEHTVEAEALDREPRIYMKREDYQRAIKDPGSYAGQLLQQSYDMIGRAQARAETLMRDFKEMLDRSIDRLDDLLSSLRGEGRPAYAAGLSPDQVQGESKQDHSMSEHRSERSSTDDLDAALNALKAEPDPEASAERARQALAEEEQRRADLGKAREIEAVQERERQVQIKTVEREEPDHSVSRDRDDGMDYGR
ncbi:MobQ family relaxase [Halovulum sp. GXIMD14793]